MLDSEEGSFDLITIRVPAEFKRSLKAFCDKNGFNMSEVLLKGVKVLMVTVENIDVLEEMGRKDYIRAFWNYGRIAKHVINIGFDLAEIVRQDGKLDTPTIRKQLEVIRTQIEGVTE